MLKNIEFDAIMCFFNNAFFGHSSCSKKQIVVLYIDNVNSLGGQVWLIII